MACNLAPQCSFLYGFFQCDLPEDTIDVEITVRTLKGIHNFRKDCTSQKSTCTPWGLQVKPFPSLRKMIKAYMEERQNIANPFSPTQKYPNRPKPSPFVKLHKLTAKRKGMLEPSQRRKEGTIAQANGLPSQLSLEQKIQNKHGRQKLCSQ